MSSHDGDSVAKQLDPTNQWWHRAEVRRLSAEAMRDAILAIAGQLNLRLEGPGIGVHLTEFMTGRGQPESGPLDGAGRRSLYLKVQRNFLAPLLVTFDAPVPFSTMGRRSVSNVPAQSLIQMNDPFVWQQSENWARRLSCVAIDPSARLRWAYWQVAGRPPTAEQEGQMLQFLTEQATDYRADVNDLRVWTDLCHALLNTKEFLYVY
jgi:hypothetical protein